MITNSPRGTKDILPEDAAAWRYLEEKIRTFCGIYGFHEIRTPIFEHTELFLRGIGDTSDVVEKEMYTFSDRGGRSITLRPENTAAVVRAFLQNKLYTAPLTKLFYYGPMFRYDRPQAGRLREFHQFGVESLGSQSPLADVEVILLCKRFLKSFGLNGLTLAINSVGCPDCRPKYKAALQEFFRPKLNEMCEDCQRRFEKNPLRLLDCKNEKCGELRQGAPKLLDCLCDECREHFAKVQEYLSSLEVEYVIDNELVRGLDYYTKTAFEIKYSELGAQSAIAGGGRYDGLVESIGGPVTPAVGFAIGLERLLLALDTQSLLPKPDLTPDVFIAPVGEEAKIVALKCLDTCRAAGLRAIIDLLDRSLKAQMKAAAKSGASFAMIIGEEELAGNFVTLKNLATSEQSQHSMERVLGEIVSRL